MPQRKDEHLQPIDYATSQQIATVPLAVKLCGVTLVGTFLSFCVLCMYENGEPFMTGAHAGDFLSVVGTGGIALAFWIFVLFFLLRTAARVKRTEIVSLALACVIWVLINGVFCVQYVCKYLRDVDLIG